MRAASGRTDGRSPRNSAQPNLARAIEFRAGDPTRARNALARLEEQSRSGYVDPFVIAWLHYELGDHDAIFASIERGYEVRSPLMVFLLQARQFFWREASEDARYEALIRRMGFVVPA